ncbi:MAG: CPBP family intramembrane glutamic endopeptidase [Alphaproteobacteria bacterium]
MAGVADKEKPLSALMLFIAVAWPYYFNDFYMIALSATASLGLLWALDVTFYCLIPAVTLYVLYRRGRLAHVRESLRQPPKLWLVVCMALVISILTHFVFNLMVFPWLTNNICCRMCAPYAFPLGSLGILTAVYAAVSAGILEEVIFRAHLITLMERVLKPHMGTETRRKIAVAFVSCALFALIHWCEGPGKVVSTFLLGLLPTVIYMRSRNLWFLVLWHTIHDALAMGLIRI